MEWCPRCWLSEGMRCRELCPRRLLFCFWWRDAVCVVTPPKNKKEWIVMSVSFYKQVNPKRVYELVDAERLINGPKMWAVTSRVRAEETLESKTRLEKQKQT